MEKWIWLDEKAYPEYQSGRKTFFDKTQANFCVATFLKKLHLKENAVLSMKIAGDTRYLLKVDGTLIARTHGYMGGDYAYEDGGITCEYATFQLSLQAGEHTLQADVLANPQMTNDLSFGKGGLFAEIVVEYENGEKEFYETDDTWLAFPNDSYPSAWSYAPMQNSHKNTFACITADGRILVERRSPLPIHSRVEPLVVSGADYDEKENKLVLKGKGNVRIDLGKIYCIYNDFDIFSEGEGQLKFEFAEVDKTYLQYPQNLKVGKGKNSFAPFYYRSARYIDIEYDCQDTVTLIPQTKGCFYPMQERGEFSCSDETLNKIYEACVASVRLCLQEEHLDSPVHQEPLGTIGDYKIDSLVEYNAFGAYTLTRADILRTAEHLDKTDGFFFHTTYTLIWVDWVRDYLLYTGDLETVKEILPVMKKVIDRFIGYMDEDGLVSNAPNFMFLDWVNIDEHSLHHPPKVLGQGALSCFTYNALERYAEILVAVGKNEESQLVKGQASRLKDSINGLLWDEAEGLYIEGLPEKDGVDCGGFRPLGEGRYYGVYTNTLAVAFGIAENGREIMERLATDKRFVEPQFYFYHYYLTALLKVGLFEKYGFEVFARYRAAVEKCPSGLAEFRIGEEETMEFSDEMTPNYQYDFSHGWGATPAFHCYRAVLGVKPVANGFVDYAVEPCLGNLTWAKGRVPTPNGVIEISVRKVNGETVKEVRFIKGENENAKK